MGIAASIATNIAPPVRASHLEFRIDPPSASGRGIDRAVDPPRPASIVLWMLRTRERLVKAFLQGDARWAILDRALRGNLLETKARSDEEEGFR